MNFDLNKVTKVEVDPSLASRPNDLTSVPGIIKDINSISSRVPDGIVDLNDRLELLQRARDMVLALETPRETIVKHHFAEVSFVAIFPFWPY
jgi:hypothetical protein